MIKKILLSLALALPMLAAAQNVKIGLVDVQTIIQDLPAFKSAQTEVDAKAKKYDEEYQKLMKEAQTKLEELQNLPADTPQPVKDRRMQELQTYDQKLAEFQQMAQQDLNKAQQEALAPIYQQVQTAIQSIGKENGFTIIQEKGAVLYFGAPAEDITPLVRARLGLK